MEADPGDKSCGLERLRSCVEANDVSDWGCCQVWLRGDDTLESPRQGSVAHQHLHILTRATSFCDELDDLGALVRQQRKLLTVSKDCYCLQRAREAVRSFDLYSIDDRVEVRQLLNLRVMVYFYVVLQTLRSCLLLLLGVLVL